MAAAKAAVHGDGERVAAMLRDHRGTLLWIARRWSGSADDAEDALQRALEIYVRRLDTVDPATELAWLKVVVRHEAIDIRRARAGRAPLDALELAERIAAPDTAVQERIEREEHLARSREALAQLKPDERTALLLKAEGFSYREIGERQGWTYTKVNRAITEGRKRFRDALAGIESGAECERFRPVVAALAAGDAAAEDLLALRPHLRHCASCRATVRELHASRLRRLALHLPFLAGVMPLRWLGEGGSDATGSSGLRGLVHGALHRLGGPDAVTGAQLAAGGGGRGTALAALLSLCVGGGAGTYCLATGGLPDPVRLVQRAEPREQARRDKPRRTAERATATPSPTATPPAAEAPPRPVVTPSAASEQNDGGTRSGPRRARTKRADPQGEFGFESTAGGPATAAPASPPTASASTTTAPSPRPSAPPVSSPPATSGGEFLP